MTTPVAAAAGAAAAPASRAVTLILAATIIFSAMDGVSKFLADSVPPLEVAFGRYAFYILFLLPVLLRPGSGVTAAAVLRPRRPVLQVVRGLLMLSSALFFISALAITPLATATAIFFVCPMIQTALAIPLLGERVGPRRWAAVAVGFVGMLVVVRPDGGSVDWGALLSLGSAVSWAGAVIASRRIGTDDSAVVTTTWTGLAGFVGAALVVPFVWVTPTLPDLLLMAAMGALAVAGHLLAVKAYALAEASTLAPFTYAQIVWAGLIGLAVFGHVPDAPTLLGSAVIVASGLYIWHRERLTAPPPPATA